MGVFVRMLVLMIVTMIGLMIMMPACLGQAFVPDR